jgi:hypothetical protein
MSQVTGIISDCNRFVVIEGVRCDVTRLEFEVTRLLWQSLAIQPHATLFKSRNSYLRQAHYVHSNDIYTRFSKCGVSLGYLAV